MTISRESKRAVVTRIFEQIKEAENKDKYTTLDSLSIIEKLLTFPGTKNFLAEPEMISNAHDIHIKQLALEMRQLSKHLYSQLDQLTNTKTDERSPISHQRMSIATDNISNFTAVNIIYADSTVRFIVLKRWISVLRESMKMHDYHTAAAINLGLNNADLGRLKSLFMQLSEEDVNFLETINQQFLRDQGWALIEKAYHSPEIRSQFIPAFGGIKKQMTRIEESMKTYELTLSTKTELMTLDRIEEMLKHHIPLDFKNTSLSSVIVNSILSSQDDETLHTLERWIMILRICMQKENDYIAKAIHNGINDLQVRALPVLFSLLSYEDEHLLARVASYFQEERDAKKILLRHIEQDIKNIPASTLITSDTITDIQWTLLGIAKPLPGQSINVNRLELGDNFNYTATVEMEAIPTVIGKFKDKIVKIINEIMNKNDLIEPLKSFKTKFAKKAIQAKYKKFIDSNSESLTNYIESIIKFKEALNLIFEKCQKKSKHSPLKDELNNIKTLLDKIDTLAKNLKRLRNNSSLNALGNLSSASSQATLSNASTLTDSIRSNTALEAIKSDSRIVKADSAAATTIEKNVPVDSIASSTTLLTAATFFKEKLSAACMESKQPTTDSTRLKHKTQQQRPTSQNITDCDKLADLRRTHSESDLFNTLSIVDRTDLLNKTGLYAEPRLTHQQTRERMMSSVYLSDAAAAAFPVASSSSSVLSDSPRYPQRRKNQASSDKNEGLALKGGPYNNHVSKSMQDLATSSADNIGEANTSNDSLNDRVAGDQPKSRHSKNMSP